MRHQIILALILLLMNNSFVCSIPTNSEVEQKIKEISEKKCDEPVDPGTCKNTIRKWYFDITTKECKEFVWTGCDGNQNRFENEEECIYHCLTGESQVTSTTTTQPTTTKKVTSTTKRIRTLFDDDETTIAPVAEEERGSELTFKETGYDKTFMFAKNNTFIQMDGQYIQTFQLRLCREISFQFRTRLPHGLLVYHNIKTPDGIELEPYALYVIVEKGQLKVVHVFGKHATSVTVGEGLNRDDWHSVMVRIDVHGARLIARVDENQEEVYLKGLNHETNYGVSINLPSVVLVGGLSSEEKLHGVKYIIESFVGCIRNVVLSSGKAASDLLPITPLIATKHENVAEGCFNRCHTRHNLCFVGSKCINHYYETSCDCFGTEYEGELCDLYTATTLTLRGSSYVSYRIYDWKDRVHSQTTRISLIFKTRFDDSVLFYASGESIKHQYIAASIKNKTVYVEMDFGDGVIQKNLERIVTNNIWHNLTIIHSSKNVSIILDYKRFHLEVPGPVKKILFDPEIYFGGGPYLSKKKGLTSTNKFVGSLKYVFYNDVSILYELKKGNPKVHYIGVLQEEYNETDVDVIPITFPFATSHIWWPIVSSKNFHFKFDFRSSRITTVLAFCDITILDSVGYWELRMQDDKIIFDVISDISKNATDTASIRMSPTLEWHTIDINYMNGELRMNVDFLALETKRFEIPFNVSNRLIIGSSLRAATTGLVGCMKNLSINNTNIDPRNLMETEQVVGEVALDNCNYIDPCKRPNTCEHGGKCFVKDDRITCDCTGTGYVGKNCHFTQYRKTCEELALDGYVKSDVYLIDIDGNGIFPPAHVKCQFQSLNDETITIVEHNLPSQIDVRSRKEIDFSFNIKYREFSPHMLQELLSHSLYCKQYIRYDCYKAPLELYSSTWFTSSEGSSLRMQDDKIIFDVISDISKNATDTASIRMSPTLEWHTIDINYMNGELRMNVDFLALETKRFEIPFNVSNRLIIGSSLRAATTGLVGCMKNLSINNTNIDPRNLMETEQVVGEVALDNCNYIDPCKRPNTCEHGGKCFVKDDRITCDCTGTGYVGKNCHFTQYRKTCEELALDGYVKSDVYLIDIDGNGIFPPAHVKCQFQSLNDETITIVEHNLPSQIDVRSRKEIDFSFNIKYREFSPHMLQELISHSLYCKQYIRYDCYKAPLELYSSTWFTSSANNFTVDYLGSAKRGSCECSMNKTCENPTQSCNCDNNENKWYSDDGEFKDTRSLGITGMYFLQQRDLDEEAQGRITLGPLECVETNTQRYVVTFTTSQSYIEVPGWRKGDIAFSFRTTGEKAILLFQPPIRPNYPSFMVALTGENQLTFNFTLNTGTTRELVINSTKKLNAGEWHKIWIDYNEYHVRFMINTDYQMVDLLQKEEFGPFEGSMFIGGATADLSKKLSVKQGLIGCFRGLVVNGEILDIYSYMSVHLSEIIKDCKPSCVPSPCKNGAQCKELWSTFQCVCKNPWAHVGEFCEININHKALTFINRSSYFIRNYVGNVSNYEEKEMIKNILTQNLLLNLRTYDTHSLVLYANDHYNNFVSLYITNSKEVVFLFNNENEIVNLTIVYDELSIIANASMQIAIIRSETSTTMHVNNKNITIDKGYSLVEEYSNKPWNNPELEILSPHRPIAPPTDYFQLVIGGYDVRHLLKTNPEAEDLQGYIGCVRGFKIGNNLIDFNEILELNEAYVKEGVLPECKMSCDSTPCKNGGICTENFEKQESTCDCDQTSFIGEQCNDEKGADFIGDSIIQRKFILKDKVDTIKLQLAFSSADLRRTSRVMLLIQTENDRNYYILVGITPEGYLQFEEDREQKEKYVAIIKKNFLNNARHSVYYYRNGDNATLIVDRQPPEILKHEPRSNTPQSSDSGTNEVQIGGINTTDSRFATYKAYTGCLSNIFIQVNNYSMKPLEEYMLFTKSGAENITVINAPGVRSAQCHAFFEIANSSTQELPLNISLGTDKTWVEEPPTREPYKSIYINSFKKEEKTQVVFITLATLFVVIIICCIIEVYRTHLAYKKRIERETDEGIIWSKEQATMLHESPGVSGKPFAYKAVPFNDTKVAEPNKLATNLVGILKNGSTTPIPNNIQITPNDELMPNKIEAPDIEKEKETIKAVSLTDSQLLDQELLESIDETEELLNDENDDEQNIDSDNNNPNSNEVRPVSTLQGLAPISSISEVSLDRMDLRELHRKTDEIKV